MKRILLAGIAVLLALVILFAVLPSYSGNNQIRNQQNQSRACFRQECFSVELALTPQEQEKGLMYRESLGEGKGMLFVFPQEGIYPFWMKNTLIPLDMVWMDSNGTVVFIGKDEQPCKQEPCPITNPGKNARYVLEVDAGTSGRIGLVEGEKMELEL